jgi:hypothetical protein
MGLLGAILNEKYLFLALNFKKLGQLDLEM